MSSRVARAPEKRHRGLDALVSIRRRSGCWPPRQDVQPSAWQSLVGTRRRPFTALEFKPGKEGSPGTLGIRLRRTGSWSTRLDDRSSFVCCTALGDTAAVSLVLVGDADQLPPVGLGQVLRDLIDSGEVPVVSLSRSIGKLAIRRSCAMLTGYSKATCRCLRKRRRERRTFALRVNRRRRFSRPF